MNRLAIVIPAYKSNFLKETLCSLRDQSCRDFTLYIGDDCSPYNLWSVIEPFTHEMNIVYHRFDSNLGSGNLISHWHRCIDMTCGEEWIWLFSDDDIMDSGCVESFYSALEKDKSELYHFNVGVIDENGEEFNAKGYKAVDFKPFLSSKDFIRSRLSYKLTSFVVEYIFSRECYERYGGFVELDLAWCSDDATWAEFSFEYGIRTIEGPNKVHWRKSSVNITPNQSTSLKRRKLKSVMSYIAFLDKLYSDFTMWPLYANYFIHSFADYLRK